MRILGPVVLALVLAVLDTRQHFSFRRAESLKRALQNGLGIVFVSKSSMKLS
jgi:hypothetical protein